MDENSGKYYGPDKTLMTQKELKDIIALIDAKKLDDAKQKLKRASGQCEMYGTMSSAWRVVDPNSDVFRDIVNIERNALPLGMLTDDALANKAYMEYDRPLNIQGVLDGTASSPIAIMTAVKDRIRWLSRKLEAAVSENEELKEKLKNKPEGPDDGTMW